MSGPILPFSMYPATAGKVFPLFHQGDGNSRAVEGLGVMASVDADATWELWFAVPLELPAGTGKLRLWAVSAAVTGDAKVNPKWASLGADEDYDAITLNAEGTGTVSWAAGAADKFQELKVTLDADTLVAGEVVYMQLVFETTSWTLASVSTWLASIIWEA